MTDKEFLTREESEKAIKFWKNQFKEIYKVSTGLDFDSNLRYEGTLDFIIYEIFKIKDDKKLAAHFLYEVARKHPFVDGNKRTALLIALVVLSQTVMKGKKDFFTKIFEGFMKPYRGKEKEMDRNDMNLVKFMKDVAAGKKTYDEVLEFIDKHIIYRLE